MPFPITYRSLFFLGEGVAFNRDLVDLVELDIRLNGEAAGGIAEAAYLADRQLSDSFHGGGSTRPIADDHIRPNHQATTAILIHASAELGLVADAQIASQARQLNVTDAIAIDRENNQWRVRWVAPEAL